MPVRGPPALFRAGFGFTDADTREPFAPFGPWPYTVCDPIMTHCRIITEGDRMNT